MFQTNKTIAVIVEAFAERRDIKTLTESLAEMSDEELRRMTEFAETLTQACYLARQKKHPKGEFSA